MFLLKTISLLTAVSVLVICSRLCTNITGKILLADRKYVLETLLVVIIIIMSVFLERLSM